METETQDCAISGTSFRAFYFLKGKVVTNQTYLIAIKFDNKPSGGTCLVSYNDSNRI